MASFLTASLVLALLFFSSSVSADQRNIRAKPGKNVVLPCRAAENKDVEAAEWKKTNQSLCVYQINSFNKIDETECSNSRADLDVKNRDVSLVLKNVTTDDTGTYECWIKEDKSNRRKRSIHDYELISTVKLEVGSGNKEDGGSLPGLIVGLSVCAVVALLVGAVLYKRSREKLSTHQHGGFFSAAVRDF